MVEVTLHLQTREGSRPIPLAADQLKIGRGERADLCLDDDGLADWQATIYRDGARVWLVNETSSNLTRVNHREVPVSGAGLADGDEIRLGHHTRLWISIGHRANVPPKPRPKPSPAHLSRPLLVAVSLIAVAAIGWGAYSIQPPRIPDPSPSPSPIATVTITPTPPETPDSTPAPPQYKLYREMMTREERLDYVKEKAQAISRLMSSHQGKYEFTPQAIEAIEKYVAGYAGRLKGSVQLEDRIENCQREGFVAKSYAYFRDDLQTLYGRARCYAPLINRTFRKKGVPEVVGLYIVMVETEYSNPNKDNIAHAMGMFQFIPPTAREFGLQPEARCEVLSMVEAAASYMNRQMGQFGTDQLSMSLCVAGYNRGNGSLIRDLKTVQKEKRPERSFWELMLNSEKFDKFFEENVKYVPKFFAAAIVGENPRNFGLVIAPLSTYADSPPLPPRGLHCQRTAQGTEK